GDEPVVGDDLVGPGHGHADLAGREERLVHRLGGVLDGDARAGAGLGVLDLLRPLEALGRGLRVPAGLAVLVLVVAGRADVHVGQALDGAHLGRPVGAVGGVLGDLHGGVDQVVPGPGGVVGDVDPGLLEDDGVDRNARAFRPAVI